MFNLSQNFSETSFFYLFQFEVNSLYLRPKNTHLNLNLYFNETFLIEFASNSHNFFTFLEAFDLTNCSNTQMAHQIKNE